MGYYTLINGCRWQDNHEICWPRIEQVNRDYQYRPFTSLFMPTNRVKVSKPDFTIQRLFLTHYSVTL